MTWLLSSQKALAVRQLLGLLKRERAYFVGGAVRDHLLCRRVDVVRDVDILVLGNVDVFRAAAIENGWSVSATLFGNLEIVPSAAAWRMDFFPAADPDRTPLMLEECLGYFDLSVDAVAIPVDGGDVLDPFGGIPDARRRCATLLENCWRHPRSAHLKLVVKLMRLAQEVELSYRDLRLAEEALDRLRWKALDKDERRIVGLFDEWRVAAARC